MVKFVIDTGCVDSPLYDKELLGFFRKFLASEAVEGDYVFSDGLPVKISFVKGD